MCEPGYALKERPGRGCQLSVLKRKISYSDTCYDSTSDDTTNEISRNELVEIYERQLLDFNAFPEPDEDQICDGPRFLNIPMCVKIPVPPQRETCQPPDPVDNAGCMDCEGQVKPEWVPGDTLKYTCDPGFHVVGNPRITCQLNGEWSRYPRCVADDPTIEEPTCGEVPTIADGYCQPERLGENGRYVAGTEAECHCSLDALFGYEMLGDPFLFCKRNGEWTEAPRCREIVRTTTSAPECPLVDLMFRLDLNTMTCESSAGDGATLMRPGESATCTCHAGFVLRDGYPNTVLCNPGAGAGSWSSNVPICVPEQLPDTCFLSDLNNNLTNGYCEQLGQDQNGVTLNNREQFEVGDIVQCKCNRGYTISTYNITCIGHERWSSMPYCVRDATTQRPYDCPVPYNQQYLCPNPTEGLMAGETADCTCVNDPSQQVTLRCRRTGSYYVRGGECSEGEDTSSPLPTTTPLARSLHCEQDAVS